MVTSFTFSTEEHRDPLTYVGSMALYCGQRLTERPRRFVFQSAAVVKERAACFKPSTTTTGYSPDTVLPRSP